MICHYSAGYGTFRRAGGCGGNDERYGTDFSVFLLVHEKFVILMAPSGRYDLKEKAVLASNRFSVVSKPMTGFDDVTSGGSSGTFRAAEHGGKHRCG